MWTGEGGGISWLSCSLFQFTSQKLVVFYFFSSDVVIIQTISSQSDSHPRNVYEFHILLLNCQLIHTTLQ